MDANYWKQRCEAAEKALQLARQALPMSAQRKCVMAMLADLQQGATLDTHQISAVLGCRAERAHTLLRAMEDLGLVERAKGKPGRHGIASGWRLGHMVQVEPAEEFAQ